MYDLAASEPDALAAAMLDAFEEALERGIRAAPGHQDLVRYAMSSGHRTRPVGCLLACAAVQADWRNALDVALSVEFVHKSSVLRDDIVDDDAVRSGKPAFHVVYGLPATIATSDVLWTLALHLLAPSGSHLRALTTALYEMAAGQLEDIEPSQTGATVEQRLDVADAKTGALSSVACRLGALAGNGSRGHVEALARYGRKLGTAFQLLNDTRNLTGAEDARTAGSDVRKRRDTVLSAHARAHSTGASLTLLTDALAAPADLPDDDVRAVRAAIVAAGSPSYAEQLAAQLMSQARAELEILPPTVARDILAALTADALLSYAF
jgi:geranylgeranyl diphosphate synthase type I